MKHLTIGLFHDENLGNELAKKGTESDILMFNRKKDDLVFSFMSPVEDKLTTKTQIISTIDAAIISCDEITPELGETTTQIEKLIKDTSLEKFNILNRNIPKILEILEGIQPKRDTNEPTSIIVDHSFSVKGVGEVILGLVKTGIVHKHDKMILLPIDKEVTIRSIQMQDKDFDEASAGCRIGAAIKGATADEMKRGSVFTKENGAKIDTNFTLNFSKNPFYPELKKGVFHLTIGMQSVPVNITKIKENTIEIESEKPVCYTEKDNFILIDLNAKKLHHIGTGTIKR